MEHKFEHSIKYWSGGFVATMLKNKDISPALFLEAKKDFKKGLKILKDYGQDDFVPKKTRILLDKLFLTVSALLSEDMRRSGDFKIVLEKYIQQKGNERIWVYPFSIWCMNSEVSFINIKEQTHSIILTSGTLHPLKSFEGELNTRFKYSLQADHVINLDRQLWAGCISKIDNQSLQSIYANRDNQDYQDSIGETLVKLCEIIPNGILCFFPSYTFMKKMHDRWSSTGLSKSIHKLKHVIVEPKGSSYQFNTEIERYKVYAKKKRGAILMGVYRGKISEGLDFGDELARGVIIIGIPFPSTYNIKVKLKKEYNEEKSREKSYILNGNDWYNLQAYRAVNQAIGRCIRNKDDYGAVILLDERYSNEKTQQNLSSWISNSIENFNDLDDSLGHLNDFFVDFLNTSISGYY
eukprot:TRINITY_DN345_c0_g1_i5.p1 TRINITY_DN345_c0_g1~~TRINITY_DN345_c0_g1_i5.p1  ORF type:complete len:408 (+),score=71.82 TRINITY_DN345_c0_g1_i5:1072-2295(+)